MLLDIVNEQRCSRNIIAYDVTLHGGELMHVFCSDDFIFWYWRNNKQKVQKTALDAQVKGVKKLQCNDDLW